MNVPQAVDELNAPTPRCPFCRSEDTELYALFGSLLSTCQYYCRSCRTCFEWIKWEPQPACAPNRPADR